MKPVFLPAGVADPEKRIGYIADMPRGIEALDLGDAQRIWLNAVTARPVIVKDDLLAALRVAPGQANTLQLIVLDRLAGGKLLVASEPLLFPESISPSVEMNDSFRYEVSIQNMDLLIRWEAQTRYRGGAAPPAHILAAAGRTENGVARIHLDTDQVEMLPSEKEDRRQLPDALQAATMLTEPWCIDDELAVVLVEISGEQQVLRLQKWKPGTGTVSEPAPLITGAALVSYVTPDGCYLFVHSEAQTQSSVDKQIPWWLFSIESGKLMARLNYEPGSREACVLDSRVYYIVEDLQPILKAIDIASGSLIWEHPLSPRPTTPPPPLRQ